MTAVVVLAAKQGQSECCLQSQQSNTWFTLMKHEFHYHVLDNTQG